MPTEQGDLIVAYFGVVVNPENTVAFLTNFLLFCGAFTELTLLLVPPFGSSSSVTDHLVPMDGAY